MFLKANDSYFSIFWFADVDFREIHVDILCDCCVPMFIDSVFVLTSLEFLVETPPPLVQNRGKTRGGFRVFHRFCSKSWKNKGGFSTKGGGFRQGTRVMLFLIFGEYRQGTL